MKNNIMCLITFFLSLLNSNAFAESNDILEFCESQSQKVAAMMSEIQPAGIISSKLKINQTCEAMFDAGDELFVLGTVIAGGSLNSSSESKPAVVSCYKNLRENLTRKASSIYRFFPRCQALVDKHPLLYTGGCADNQWCDRYYFGARVFNLTFGWENNL